MAQHTTECYHLWSTFGEPLSPGSGWDQMCVHLLNSKNKTIYMLAAEEWDLADFHNPKLKADLSELNRYIRSVERHCEINNVNLHIISGRYSNYRNKHTDDGITENTDSPWESFNTHFWSTYWLYHGILRYRHPQNNDLTGNYVNKPVPTRPNFVCYINRPHPYRCYLVDQFARLGLLENNLVSFLMSTAEHGVQYQFEHWQESQLVIPGEQSIADNYQNISHHQYRSCTPEYHNTICDVVPESGVGSLFLTEKTVLPILRAKPFVVVGAPGFHSMLQELGFQLYTPLFDYGFDSVSDARQRIQMITQQLHRMQDWSTQQVADVYAECRPICEHNLRTLFSLVATGAGIPDIITQQEQLFRAQTRVGAEYYDLIDFVQQLAQFHLNNLK